MGVGQWRRVQRGVELVSECRCVSCEVHEDFRDCCALGCRFRCLPCLSVCVCECVFVVFGVCFTMR